MDGFAVFTGVVDGKQWPGWVQDNNLTRFDPTKTSAKVRKTVRLRKCENANLGAN